MRERLARSLPNESSALQRLALALTCAIVTLLCPVFAHAAEPARIVILRSQAADPLIDEALIRTRGELTGFGLESSVLHAEPDTLEHLPSFGADVYGVLLLARSERGVEIRAYSPGSTQPLVQEIDPQKPGVNAEVVAVRAVETLRAALLEYAQRAQAKEETLPPAVTAFAEDRPAERSPKQPEPAAPSPPAPDVKPEPVPPQDTGPRPVVVVPRERPKLRIWIGPAVSFDAEAAGRPGLGAEVGAAFEPAWLLVGLNASATLSPWRVEAAAGSATIQRRSAELHFGTRWALSRADIVPTVGAGLASYTVEGEANTGYRDRSANHLSGVFSVSLGTAYWFMHRLGVYLSLRGTAGTDAPVVRIDEREVITLERPTLSLSLGLIAGAY